MSARGWVRRSSDAWAREPSRQAKLQPCDPEPRLASTAGSESRQSQALVDVFFVCANRARAASQVPCSSRYALSPWSRERGLGGARSRRHQTTARTGGRWLGAPDKRSHQTGGRANTGGLAASTLTRAVRVTPARHAIAKLLALGYKKGQWQTFSNDERST